MKVKVVGNRDGNSYLTVGRTYDAEEYSDMLFGIYDDGGDAICCLWENCSHGYDYERVEEEDTNVEFKVGDKVKCLHPVVVVDDYKDVVGVVKIPPEQERCMVIQYADGNRQIAFVDTDGVVLVESTQDTVNHPNHYGQGFIEAIEYIRDSLTKEEYLGYLQGNIKKYLHRWRYKNGIEDLKKARVYLGWLIEESEA